MISEGGKHDFGGYILPQEYISVSMPIREHELPVHLFAHLCIQSKQIYLSRLTLAVAFLYVRLISIGGHTTHEGLRTLVDRNDRRDLSIFQIGLRFTQRRLTNSYSVSVPLFTYL